VNVVEKVQVVENLPKGWKWRYFGDLVNNCDGRRVPIKLDERRERNGEFPYYGASGVIDFIDDYLFDGEYLLIGEDGANLVMRSTPIAFRASGKFWVNNHAHVVQPKEEVLLDYLIHCFSAMDLQRYITGSAQPKLSQEKLNCISIPLPPLLEQKWIVGILSDRLTAIDKARTATEAQLKAAKALPAAYLRQVFDSPEAQKWKRKKFGDVARIVASQVDPKIPEYGVLPHVNGENIESGTGRLTYLNTAEEEGMTSGKYMFDPGDVLYSKLRPYLRKVVLVDFQGLCSADMYPIKFDPQWLDSEFSVWLLLSDKFTSYANEASARARMPKLNREQLFEWEALIPPLKKQQEIAAFINQQSQATNTLVDALQSQLTTINQLPAATLRQAFNGEL